MNNNLIDETAESTSLSLINVFYVVNLILSIIAIIVGIVTLEHSVGGGLTIIVLTIIYLLFVILVRALCQIFINISLKLDNENAVLEEIKILNAYLKEKGETLQFSASKSMVEENEESTTSSAFVEETLVEEEEDLVPIVKHTFDYELEKEVFNKIREGKELEARTMLIQKKGLSELAAKEYIETIKDTL